MTAFLYVAMTCFILVCVILILLILIQKGRGGGLASAFGGAGGQTAFGSKTGDVLTWATSIVFAVFVVLAVCLNLIANRIDNTRNKSAVIPVVSNQPVLPGSPNSSLPQAPAPEPGITNPPPANVPAQPTTLPAAQAMTRTNTTALPSTMPTVHVTEPVPMATTFPTTSP